MYCDNVTNNALVRSPQILDDAEKEKKFKLKVTELQYKLQL